MGLLFFPRGGSSHVAQNLAAALPGAGWRPTILSGSLSLPGRPGDARVFYRGLDVHTVDFTPALAAPDPLSFDPPFHPSYEDREGAPDAVFARLDEAAYERQVDAWARALADAGAAEADVLHLHHLTPLNEAAARVAPNVPVVGHLHGTELLMLEAIELGDAEWPYGEEWETRMRRWAKRCGRLIVLSDNQVHRAEGLLGIDARALRAGLQRLRPRAVPAAPGRSRGALAAPPRRRSAGLAAGRGGGQRRLPGGGAEGLRRAARRCSTWGASPPSSGSGC